MSLTEIPNGWRYSPPAEHRIYRPPAEPEPFVAPKVTASAADVDGTVIEKADAVLTPRQRQFWKALQHDQ